MTAAPLVLWQLEPTDARGQLAAIAALDAAGIDAVVLGGAAISGVDPVLIAAAASRRSPRIGLIAELTPWIQPPFHTARVLGTLDALTSGRAGWFVDDAAPEFRSSDDTPRWNPTVAGDEEAGAELAAAAAEYVDTALALWNTWEPDAVIADVEAGQYVDPAKVHVADVRGAHYAVRGPLNMPRSPQGRPVLLARAGTPVAARADVLVVAAEVEVGPARRDGIRVLLEVTGDGMLTPPATEADGYLVTGVPPGELFGRLVHGVLPTLASSRVGLLRDRLGLPASAFDFAPALEGAIR